MPHIRSPLVSFDDIDYEDKEQIRQAQESMVREQYIRVASLKVTRKALEYCYKTSGPNHYEDCKELADKYLAMLPLCRISGSLGYQKNDVSK